MSRILHQKAGGLLIGVLIGSVEHNAINTNLPTLGTTSSSFVNAGAITGAG
jgi:hypothetical protein